MVEKCVATNKQEALEFLANHDSYIVAGGSDIMVQKKNVAGALPLFDKDVLYISNVEELRKIYEDEEGVHIGAAVTLEEVLKNELTPNLLKKCVREVASVNVRHFGTLVGNICNASPAGDPIVVDVVLDAVLKIESLNEVRYLKASDFVVGVRKIDRQQNELVTEIIFPKQTYTNDFWMKVGSRRSDSISKVSVAGYYEVKNDVLTKFVVAFGAVSSKVARSEKKEYQLVGKKLCEIKAIQPRIAGDFAEIINPIDDQRSNKEYRTKVALNILNKFLDEIVGGDR